MPTLRRLRGIIFDCDGVMIDSVAANREFYNRIRFHYGLPAMSRKEETYSFMATSEDALRFLLPESLHADIPHMARDVVNYRREIIPLIKVFPGFLDFAAFMQEHAIKMAVLTNRTDAGMQAVLDFFHMPPYFDPVVTASSVLAKPDPGGARMILSRWGLADGDVLYVGDTEVDRQTARAANLAFAAMQPYEWQNVGGDFRVADYVTLREQLLPAMESGRCM